MIDVAVVDRNKTIIEGPVKNINLSHPILYIDNEARGRSGNIGHAMVNLGNGKIMAFNSNTSPIRCDGHSGFGWMEYRISEDYGETFGDFNIIPYTKEVIVDGDNTAIIEAATACADGSVIAFCNIFSQERRLCCSPYGIPTYIRSSDGGKTWEEAKPLSDFKGRVYAARTYNGAIYVLEFCHLSEVGKYDDDLYRIFVSYNNGITFSELCIVPFESSKGRFFGSMQFDNNGNLFVYAGNMDYETQVDYAVSSDCGKTWDKIGTCQLHQGIKNPQVAFLDGQFLLHGKETAGINGFLLYISSDGINWDKGRRIEPVYPGSSFYSNNVLVPKDGKNRLLIQYSKTYKHNCNCVNIYHRWIESID